MQSKAKTTIYAILNEIMEDTIIGASAIDIINKINLIRRKITVSYTHLRAHETVLDLV